LHFSHLSTGNPYAYDKPLPNFWCSHLEMSRRLISDEQTVAETTGKRSMLMKSLKTKR